MERETSSTAGGKQPEEESATLAGIYNFLAQAMRYPDSHLYAADYPDTLMVLLELLHRDQEKKELAAWKAGDGDRLEELQVEYTRLFINSGQGPTPAPPYASVYLDGGMLQGGSTEQLAALYRQQGFEPDGNGEPVDHLSFQLQFLALLTARDRHDGSEEKFLADFFRPWFQLFYTKVLENTRHPFYRVSVQLIDFLTKEEINGDQSNQA